MEAKNLLGNGEPLIKHCEQRLPLNYVVFENKNLKKKEFLTKIFEFHKIPQRFRIQGIWKHRTCATMVFFFYYSLTTSTANWVQTFTCMLFYAYVGIHKVWIWQLPKVSSAFIQTLCELTLHHTLYSIETRVQFCHARRWPQWYFTNPAYSVSNPTNWSQLYQIVKFIYKLW